jgi:hypothetical protein
MTPLRSFARLVAIGPLLFAADDLLGLGACEDSDVVVSQTATVFDGDDDANHAFRIE